MLARRFFLAVFPLLALPILNSCSGDSDPVNPPPPEPEAELLAEATIGPAGGTLEGAGVVITVDPGMFPQEADLALYALETPTEEGAMTGQFRLAGLPPGAVFRLALTVTGTPTEGHYLQAFTGKGTPQAALVMIPAALNDGALHSALVITPDTKPHDKRAGKASEDVIADFLGVSGIVSFNLPSDSDPLFQCKVPAYRRVALESLMAPVVDLVTDLRDQGFRMTGYDDYSEASVQFDPIEVLVQNRLNSSGHGFVGVSGDRYFSMPHQIDCSFYINPSALDGANLTAARDFFLRDFALEYIDAVMTFPENDPLRHLWFAGAFREWTARTYQGSGQQPAAPVGSDLMATFGGLYQGADLTLDPPMVEFARGMGHFLAWAADDGRWGPDWIKQMVDLSDHDDLPTPANIITACAGQTSDQWWPAYVRDLAEGDVVAIGDVPWVEAASGVWSINDPDDSGTQFSGSFADLSARIYSIRLDHNDIDASAEARFALDSDELDLQDLEMMVFRRQGGELTFLASGQEVWIGGLREMRMSGAHLLAVVCNSYYETPYSATRNATLAVTLEEEPEGGVFDLARVDFRLGLVTENMHYEGDGCWQADGPLSTSYLFDLSGGSWTGTTYQVYHDQTFSDPSYRDQVSLQIVLNGAGTEVESFHFDWTQTQYGVTNTVTDHMVVSWAGGGLPYVSGAPDTYVYQLIGLGMADHLGTWTHVRDWSEEDCQRTVTDIEVKTFSIVRLEFSP